MLNCNCKIGKVTPKLKVVHDAKISSYQCEADVLEFTRDFFDVLRNEPVISVGIVYETSEGTGSNFIITAKGTWSMLIAQCDILKHKLVESYLTS